ncbi:formamidase [Ascosphaera apis ARSEF 7405]|uniref:Formamidase n=1 Tax=Ascosphaera apis ARSEF 7405 TaxID=392613 RepID=A0A168CWZ9_9EURO|nr:formamidase [Ascosphaera apis ARSEF 7405]
MPPIRTAIAVDLKKPAKDQPCLHNRWHPEIPPAARVEPGETVHVQCVDWTGGQISDNDSADDIRDVDLTHIHYLSGPFEVATAEPGDALVVDIIDVQPLPEQPWGFTGVFAKTNGGGFLDEFYPDAVEQKQFGTLKAFMQVLGMFLMSGSLDLYTLAS